MVPYFLENIRFLKTLREYEEEPYPIEKTTIAFHDPPKKKRVTFVRYSWNSQGIFLYSIFAGYYFGISPEFHWEFFPNMLAIFQENVPQIF